MMTRIAIVLCLAPIMWAGGPPKAFRPVKPTRPAPANLLDRTVLRIREVVLDTALFNSTAARKLATRKKRNPSADLLININVFPDVALLVHWTSAEQNQDGGLTWTGSVEGAPLGQAVLILAGASVVGNLARGDGKLYQIRTTADSSVWVREIDQNKFPGEAKPLDRQEQRR